MEKAKLSERKQKILQALVDSYITSVEPISSSVIQSKYLSDVSPATVRSELSMLEEMGYLTQPHISSGRIPSSKAYKYYVENFIDENDIDEENLKSGVEKKFASIEEIAKNGAKIISDVTNYTSMLWLNNIENIIIKDVKLVDLFDGTALVLIITDSGAIKNKQINLPSDLRNDYIEMANSLLVKTFVGKTLAEAVNSDDILKRELDDFQDLCRQVVELVLDYKKSQDSFVIEGADKIFDYPEYNDIDNVKNFMSVVSHKEKLYGLMNDDGNIEYSIKIGSEDSTELSHMALISASYRVNGQEIGKVGVIGPERMDYKKVLGVLKQLGKLMDKKKE
ncbi:MAG: heat-inducible transcriptional repressor HrcA [Clostridia bacterium]